MDSVAWSKFSENNKWAKITDIIDLINKLWCCDNTLFKKFKNLQEQNFEGESNKKRWDTKDNQKGNLKIVNIRA